MVHVKVHNRNFLNLVSVLRHGVAGGNSHVVNKAETIAASFRRVLVVVVIVKGLAEDACMMAWWPSRAESVSVLATHHCVDCLHSCSCGEQCSSPSHLRHSCVTLIEMCDDFVAGMLKFLDLRYHPLDVRKVMDFQNVHHLAGTGCFLNHQR